MLIDWNKLVYTSAVFNKDSEFLFLEEKTLYFHNEKKFEGSSYQSETDIHFGINE